MSRVVVLVLLLVLGTLMATSTTNVRKPNELVRSCGTPLLQRVLSICGGPCFGDGELSLVHLGCYTGVTDAQLEVLCCPQQ
ncbi:hypothetical protein CAEBREN_09748 [Caenorhabditis brenneri]|uniref:Uncharacterized protein n=1 Tax=Caenorhabditis brenneri TaxID=135651 RepID=G0MJC5_CAEBE|nr:hypothetical protein CAEBREN_09748 [Caenorhabditis brenneri]